MRPRLLPFTALATVVLLAGCASLSLWPTAAIDVDLEPRSFTYTVDPERGPIPGDPLTVTFTSRPGSLGATITGYRIYFLDASRNPLIEGYTLPGSLVVRVPAGLQCTTPDDSGSCSINDPGARPAPRMAEPASLTALPVAIAASHLAQESLPGARAEIHFFGTDDNGREFNLDPVTAAITSN